MSKIPKNRQDNEMFGNLKEQITFENFSDSEEAPVAKPVKTQATKPSNADFFTPELQESVGKALLALKVKLYKEGIVDYAIKVSSEGNQVVLKAVPTNKPKVR